MLRHWITISWRVLGADRLFSLITILSLAVGCAGALLVGSYIHDQLTYEDWLPNGDRILRLEAVRSSPGSEPTASASLPGALAPLIEAAAGVEAVTRISYVGSPSSANFGVDGESFQFILDAADANHFAVFEQPFVEGTAETALAEPTSLVITASVREAMFGDEPALGRTVSVGGEPHVVTGVIEDLPRKTHLRHEALVRVDSPAIRGAYDLNTLYNERGQLNFGWAVYVRAESASAARALRFDLPPLIAELVARPDIPNGETSVSFAARPVSEVHLFDITQQASTQLSNLADLSILAAIGVTLLIVCAFNYVTLSLARALFRAREIGVRKAMGASRANLVVQYLLESAVLTGIAVVAGLAIAELGSPWFAAAIERPLEDLALHNPAFLLWAALGGLVLAVLVGAYPALYLSRLGPSTAVIRGARRAAGISRVIRYFVGVQFAVATALIGAVAVMALQARYIASQPLGYEYSDRVIVRPGTDSQLSRTPVALLRQALASAPGIVAVSGTIDLPVAWWDAPRYRIAVDGAPPGGGAGVDLISGELNLPQFYSLELLSGRWFDDELAGDRFFADHPGMLARSDSLPVIVTKQAARALGAVSPFDALGRRFRVESDAADARIRADQALEVVGVVNDIRYESLRFASQPIVFRPDPRMSYNVMVRLDPGRRDEAAAAIRNAWSEIDPGGQPFITPLGERVSALYADDQRLMRLAGAFSLLAVLIACLGLYGLSAFAVRRRHHEIAIRKSLGADSAQMTRFMVLRFLRPVLIAVPLGWLGAYLFAQEWLLGFANHAVLTPLPFVGSGIAALGVAAGTVYVHARSAARASPAVVLRDL